LTNYTPPSTELQDKCISELFPQRRIVEPTVFPESDPPLPYTKDELKDAAKRLAPRKAPGPDGIPPEVVKIAAERHPDQFLDAFNDLFSRGVYPKEWKAARLILIPKPGKDSFPLPNFLFLQLRTLIIRISYLSEVGRIHAVRSKRGGH